MTQPTRAKTGRNLLRALWISAHNALQTAKRLARFNTPLSTIEIMRLRACFGTTVAWGAYTEKLGVARLFRVLFRPHRRALLEETAFVAETVRRLSVPHAAPGITRAHVIAARWHLRRVEQSFLNHHRLAGWQMRVAHYPYQPVSPEAP